METSQRFTAQPGQGWHSPIFARGSILGTFDELIHDAERAAVGGPGHTVDLAVVDDAGRREQRGFAFEDHHLAHPDLIPASYRDTEADEVTQVVDYVSGMTDRFALNMHDRLFDADAASQMTPLLRDIGR